MLLSPYPINRTIYKDKQLTLALYVAPPETITLTKKYQVNCNATLYLQMNQTIPGESTEDWKSKSYAIRQSNHYNVLMFFDNVMAWFRNTPDMFLEGESGKLVLNGKYNELSELSQKNFFDNGQLKAIPAIIEVAHETYEEGLYLFINRTTNMVRLTKSQVSGLFNILRTFKFADEILLSVELLKLTSVNGSLISNEQYRERLANTGFRPQ